MKKKKEISSKLYFYSEYLTFMLTFNLTFIVTLTLRCHIECEPLTKFLTFGNSIFFYFIEQKYNVYKKISFFNSQNNLYSICKINTLYPN